MPLPHLLCDLLAFLGFALITAGGVGLLGWPALVISGAALLGFAVWATLCLNRQVKEKPDNAPE